MGRQALESSAQQHTHSKAWLNCGFPELGVLWKFRPLSVWLGQLCVCMYVCLEWVGMAFMFLFMFAIGCICQHCMALVAAPPWSKRP